MSLFLILAFLFFIGSTLGWVLELFYRRFFSKVNGGKWMNPGFLQGPYLPLYGFGLCLLYLLAQLPLPITKVWLRQVVLFLLMAAAMTAIEYVAGLIFIRGMKVQLWDYSDCWGNIQGMICPRFSFYWSCLGALYYFFIHPHILNALLWLSENLAFSFVIGFFFGIFIIDVFYSMQIGARVRRFAAENGITVRYEELKLYIQSESERRRTLLHFWFSFRSDRQFTEELIQYIRNRMDENEWKRPKKWKKNP